MVPLAARQTRRHHGSDVHNMSLWPDCPPRRSTPRPGTVSFTRNLTPPSLQLTAISMSSSNRRARAPWENPGLPHAPVLPVPGTRREHCAPASPSAAGASSGSARRAARDSLRLNPFSTKPASKLCEESGAFRWGQVQAVQGKAVVLNLIVRPCHWRRARRVSMSLHAGQRLAKPGCRPDGTLTGCCGVQCVEAQMR